MTVISKGAAAVLRAAYTLRTIEMSKGPPYDAQYNGQGRAHPDSPRPGPPGQRCGSGARVNLEGDQEKPETRTNPQSWDGKWHYRFLDLAGVVASWSKDPSTKVGCVLADGDRNIVSTGYNGLPRGVHDLEQRLVNRDTKYLIITHAEANAVASAARRGAKTEGCTAFVTHPPCGQCMALLVQAGISAVVVPQGGALTQAWGASLDAATAIAEEAGVRYVTVDGTVDGTDKNRT